MQQNKSRNIIRIVGGLIFALLLIPAAWLIVIGISKLTMLANRTFPDYLAVPLAILLFAFLVIITVISKANIGGDALKISMRELFKKKNKDEHQDR